MVTVLSPILLLLAAVEWDFSNAVVIIMVSSSYFRDAKFVGVDHRLILDPDLSDTLQLRMQTGHACDYFSTDLSLITICAGRWCNIVCG